jgi:hypothetical protein
MARSADTICDASASGSEAATGGSGRGVGVGNGDGVAVATTTDGDGDGTTDSAGRLLETAHAESKSAIAPETAGRLTKPLGRTRRRARGADRARARSA